MPFVTNSSYTGGASRSGEAAQKIAESLGSIFGGGDPAELARASAYGAQSQKDLADAALNEYTLERNQNLGTLYEGLAPNGQTLGGPEYQQYVQTKLIPGLLQAQQGGSLKDAIATAAIFSGQDNTAFMGNSLLREMGPDSAVSMGHQEDIAARNATNELTRDLAVQDAKPLSMDELKARSLSGVRDDAQIGDALFMELLSGVTPRNVSLPGEDGAEGDKTVAIGNMFLDPAGEYKPLPYGSHVWSAQTTGAGPEEALGLTPSVKTMAQKQIMALDSLDDTIAQIEGIAAVAPENFGTAGVAKSTAQDLIAQGNSLGQLLETSSLRVQGDIVRRGDMVNSSYFDPSLPALELLTNTLAYQYATAIAGNERISDSDFLVAKQAVGDPLSFMGSSDKTLAKMKVLRGMSQSRRQALAGALNNGVGGTSVPVGSSPISGAKVRMRAPNGELFDLDASEKEDALRNGWSISE